MSGTSESLNDFRCAGCDKCLARDGEIQCLRCDTHNPIHRHLARAAAQAMCGRAVIAHCLTAELPSKITVQSVPGDFGYAEYRPSKSIAGRFIPSRDQLVAELTAVMAQAVAEAQVAGAPSSAWAFEHALRLARNIIGMCDFRDDDDAAALDLIEQCRAQAKSLVDVHRDRIAKLAEALMAKGELDTASLNALLTA